MSLCPHFPEETEIKNIEAISFNFSVTNLFSFSKLDDSAKLYLFQNHKKHKIIISHTAKVLIITIVLHSHIINYR